MDLFNAYNLGHILGNLTQVAIASGLAGSASYQSAADRYILWSLRNQTVPELNVTVQEAFDQISALRQNLTGTVVIDQGLTKQGGINIIPTDGNGVTLAPTPQQVLNVLTLGEGSKGGFFPSGVNGKVNTTTPLSPSVSLRFIYLILYSLSNLL